MDRPIHGEDEGLFLQTLNSLTKVVLGIVGFAMLLLFGGMLVALVWGMISKLGVLAALGILLASWLAASLVWALIEKLFGVKDDG